MIRGKFLKKQKEELLEYIKIKMQRIKAKYPDDLIDKYDSWYWNEYFFGIYFYMPALYHYNYNHGKKTLYGVCPSEEFLKRLNSVNEVTTDTFELVKWCLDGLELWFEQMYAQAEKDEEEIQEVLNQSEAYIDYKSLKVAETLERG